MARWQLSTCTIAIQTSSVLNGIFFSSGEPDGSEEARRLVMVLLLVEDLEAVHGIAHLGGQVTPAHSYGVEKTTIRPVRCILSMLTDTPFIVVGPKADVVVLRAPVFLLEIESEAVEVALGHSLALEDEQAPWFGSGLSFVTEPLLHALYGVSASEDVLVD